MNVAVSSTGTNLNSQVDPRFGRCQYFVIVDTDTMDFKSYPNEFSDYSNGAGIQSAQFIVSEGATALITGSCGPKAMQVFTAAGVNVHVGYSGTVAEAVERFKKDGPTTVAASDSSVAESAPAGGAGMGRGMGMGGGAGMGMGRRGGCGRGMGRGMGMGGGAGMGGRTGMGRGMGMGGGAGMAQGVGTKRDAAPLVDQNADNQLTENDSLQTLKSQAQALKNKLAEITGRIKKIEKD